VIAGRSGQRPFPLDASRRIPDSRDGGAENMVIVLNGGSSSGKSSIARCLQALLPVPWLTFGVDTLMAAMPAALWDSTAGIALLAGGEIAVGPAVRHLYATWVRGVAAMAQDGTGLILDEVLLDGVEGQRQWQVALAGVPVLWVGVRCDPAVAAAREAARGDRVAGMAASQAQRVHRSVAYDLEVDTTQMSAVDCARIIAKRIG